MIVFATLSKQKSFTGKFGWGWGGGGWLAVAGQALGALLREMNAVVLHL